MNTNEWNFTWKPTRAEAGLPIEAEKAVRSFYLDEFGVQKPFTYRGKNYTIELRPSGSQGAGFFIIATRLDDGVEIAVTPHFVKLPKELVCKVTFPAKRTYKKKGTKSEDTSMEEDTAGSDDDNSSAMEESD